MDSLFQFSSEIVGLFGSLSSTVVGTIQNLLDSLQDLSS